MSYDCLLTAYYSRRRVKQPLKLLGWVYICTRRTAWRKRERRLSWTQRRHFVRGSTSSRTAGRGVGAFRCTCQCAHEHVHLHLKNELLMCVWTWHAHVRHRPAYAHVGMAHSCKLWHVCVHVCKACSSGHVHVFRAWGVLMWMWT